MIKRILLSNSLDFLQCFTVCSTQPQFGQSVYQTSIPDTIATGQIVYSLQIQDYNSQVGIYI
jgi:hypothetical protein